MAPRQDLEHQLHAPETAGDDDPLGAAKGIFVGLAIGAACWLGLAAAVVALF